MRETSIKVKEAELSSEAKPLQFSKARTTFLDFDNEVKTSQIKIRTQVEGGVSWRCHLPVEHTKHHLDWFYK